MLVLEARSSATRLLTAESQGESLPLNPAGVFETLVCVLVTYLCSFTEYLVKVKATQGREGLNARVQSVMVGET